MKKINKILIGMLTVLTQLFSSTMTVMAAQHPEVIFDGKSETFSFKNIETAQNGNPKLFFGFENAIPGDSFEQEITVKTKNMDGKTVHMYLRSVNEAEDYNEILESAILTVEYDGQEVRPEHLSFDTMGGGIKLGTFTTSASKEILVTFSIPLEVDNRISKLYGTIDWIFVAELIDDKSGTPNDPDTTDNPTTPDTVDDPDRVVSSYQPKTGDDSQMIIWFVVALVTIAGIFVCIKHVKDKRKSNTI